MRRKDPREEGNGTEEPARTDAPTGSAADEPVDALRHH